MANPNLRSIESTDGAEFEAEIEEVEVEYEPEVLPAERSAGELIARTARAIVELPPPVIAASGVAAGVAFVSGVRVVNDARKARALRRRREASGPLIAIISEKIQIDLRSPRRR